MDSTTCGDRSRFRALSPRNDCTVCIAFTRRGDKIGTTDQQKTPAFLGRSQADCPGDPTLADRYDQKKYWPKVYTSVRREFGQPAGASPDAIRDALRWKWGHLSKPAFPAAHARLIAQIQDGWSDAVAAMRVSVLSVSLP